MGRVVWLALILACGAFLSVCFACATPFAALATLAGLKLGRRDAVVALSLIWLANQIIGYGFLDYPRTWDCVAWGLAIGISAGLALLATKGLSTTRPASLTISLPFMASFTAFELGLYITGLALPGSEGAFEPVVVWHIFLINLETLCGLLAAYRVFIMMGCLKRSETSGLSAASVTSFS